MADYIEEMEEELKKYEKTKIYPNIVLLGGTGCGKSSLVNNIFGVNIAKVSDIQPETQEFESFKGKDYGIYVNLIDSKGYELEDNSDNYIIRLKEKISSMEMKNEKIHIVWFCLSVAKKRIEEIDIAILEKVLEIKELKGRVFVAFTKCDEDDNKGSIVIEYKKILQTNFSNLKMYEVSNDENLKLELDNLIEESAMCLNNNDLKDSFISSQTRNLELKKRYAESAMKKYIGLAATAGAVPIPFSDSAVLIPLQLKMITEITGIYGMRNFATISKGVVSDIVIGNIGKSIAGSLLKFIPGVGSIVGGAINASVASAITYALGKAVSEICFKNCNKILNGMEIDSFDIFNSDILVELSKSFFNEYNKKK